MRGVALSGRQGLNDDGRAAQDSEAESDETLMRRIGEGNRAAFATLLRRHLQRTQSLATRLTGSASDGEEVAQEAFQRVWTHAARWKPVAEGGKARFTTWLYRITANLAIDRRRKPRTTPIEDAPEPIDESADGFARVHERQLGQRVGTAVSALPPRQREVLVLCFYEGRSNVEAAELLDLTVGAVESLLVRARRALRATLADAYADLKETGS
ncbi:RNA polymerase sigma factor [Roseiterribacter gracilis]|uniref:RNA polymerase sigma factor n=1 Tax=Roseiterribacter gracilis TaxID=2812848 RepID=A0A8S8XL48_9PROT|nr:RNA polymerase sigma factor [Rhodospirillales bacterium TMPK1]